MSNNEDGNMNTFDGMGGVGQDAEQQTHIGFADDEQTTDDTEPVEIHDRHERSDPSHVVLAKDDYTPQEVARMFGTSLEVVMSAVRDGELKAEREGQDVVCIQRADVLDWLRQRGPGI